MSLKTIYLYRKLFWIFLIGNGIFAAMWLHSYATTDENLVYFIINFIGFAVVFHGLRSNYRLEGLYFELERLKQIQKVIKGEDLK